MTDKTIKKLQIAGIVISILASVGSIYYNRKSYMQMLGQAKAFAIKEIKSV